MAEKKRLQYLDIARGIGMICIILGHLGNDTINRIVYPFHVPLFFLIAGYFINEKKNFTEFLKSRARTLLVPYAATSLVMIIIAAIEGLIMYGAEYGAAGALQGVNWINAALYGSGSGHYMQFDIKGIGAIWFLLALFWGSIIVRASLYMNKWVRAALMIALFAVGWLTKDLFWFPFSLQPGLCAATFVYIGWIVGRYKERLMKVPLAVKIAFLVICAAAYVVFMKRFWAFWFVSCEFGDGVQDILLCLCSCLVVIFISWLLEKVPLVRNGLSVIGRYSLIILCIHNIELNQFPWTQIANILVEKGMPSALSLPFIIAGKLILDLVAACLLLKIRPVRKLFRY